jgi:hypothetical protein
MPHEVTAIKGRRFPTCRHCKGIRFELAHAAKHGGEVDQLEEAHAPAGQPLEFVAMPRAVAGRRRTDAAALPLWIAPQLTQLVDAAPDGDGWLQAAAARQPFRIAAGAQPRALGAARARR